MRGERAQPMRSCIQRLENSKMRRSGVDAVFLVSFSDWDFSSDSRFTKVCRSERDMKMEETGAM